MTADKQDSDQVGQLVRARTAALQRLPSSLAQRGLEQLSRLLIDPEVAHWTSEIRNGKSWEARSTAWQKLRQMGPQRIGWESALRDLIYTSDGWGRIFAAESLAFHSKCQEDAVPVLIATIEAGMKHGSYDWVRVACGSIGKYKELNPSVKGAAIGALMAALECEDYNVSGYAAESLSTFGADAKGAIPKMVSLARSKENWLRDIYWSILQRFQPSIEDPVDALIWATTSSDAKVRGEAVCEIAKFEKDADKAIPRLLSLATDQSADVRRFLGFAFGHIQRNEDKVRATVDRLFHDQDLSVCTAAAYASLRLGINLDDSHGFLCMALHEKDSFVRYLSSWALGKVGQYKREKSISKLRGALLAEEDAQVRHNIENSLRRLGHANQGIDTN